MKYGLPFLLLVVATTSACAPTGGAVANDPPKIEPADTAFSVKYGVMNPDIMSAILWPTTWSEAQYESNVRAVDDDGKALVKHFMATRQLDLQINALWRQYWAVPCLAQNPDGSSPATPDQFDEIQDETALTPVSADCQKNRDQRAALRNQENLSLQSDGDPNGDYVLLNADIQNKLGPTGRNIFLGTDTTTSRFVISADPQGKAKIDIVLGSFLGSTNPMSTTAKNLALRITDVSLSAAGDQLGFTVPDPTPPANPGDAKITYVFSLQRIAPLFTFLWFNDDQTLSPIEEAVYKGDVAVMQGTAVTAMGSVQIIGKFTGTSP